MQPFLPSIPTDFSDHRYAIKQGVPLWLRVYPAPRRSCPQPWLLWIHGGSYCSGQHYQMRTWILPLFHSLGIHVISIAHRFIPHVAMDDMVKDCVDAYAWCRDNLGAVLADRGGCRTEYYAVGGDSAGGGLACLLALKLTVPSPRVVINVYGVTDFVLQHASIDRSTTTSWSGNSTEAEMRVYLKDQDPAHAVTTTANLFNLEDIDSTVLRDQDEIALHLKNVWNVSDAEWVYDEGVKRQWSDIKSYISHHKLMVDLCLRLDASMSQSEVQDRLKSYSIVHLLDNAAQFPPTVFLHGTEDVAVPIEESISLAKALRLRGMETEEIYCEGVGHCWDNIYQKPGDEGWEEYIAPIGRFVGERLGM